MADRPTPEEWKDRCPELRRVKTQLEGPCPLCGGNDRFHVNLAPPHKFGCRQCGEGKEILGKVFGGKGGQTPSHPIEECIDAVYRDANGREAVSFRKDWPRDWDGEPCDFKDCKQSTPHKHIWRKRGGPSRGLLLLLWQPDKPLDTDLVVIVEGEKAARAVKSAGYIAASYCGGSAAVRYADYSPVEGHPVLVWPDADSAGGRAAKTALQKAYEAGAFEVYLLPIDKGLSNGADAADYSLEEVKRLVSEALEGDPSPRPDVGLDIQGPPSKVVEQIQPNKDGMRTSSTTFG